MNHSEFKVGTIFQCSGKKWLTTDVGTRTVIAVCLTVDGANDYGRFLSEDKQNQLWNKPPYEEPEIEPSWLNGPPYAVAEHVFDEHDLPACKLTND